MTRSAESTEAPPAGADLSAGQGGGPGAELAGLGRLAEVAHHLASLAEASPGEEICGLVEADPAGAPSVRPMTNAAASPARAYAVSPSDLLAAVRRLEDGGGALLAIFHSHPAGGSDLSATDLAQALCDGAPLWPGVAQVVIGLSGGRAEVVRAHRWDGRRYRPVDLWRRTVPEGPGEGRGGPGRAP